MKTTLRLALMAAVIGFAAPAAAQLSGNFDVTASIAKTCVFQAAAKAGDLSFGAYDPTADTAVTGSTSFQFRCTKGTVATIALDNGDHFGATRRMVASTAPAELLAYNLFQPSGEGAASTATATAWGAGASAFVAPAAPSSGWMTFNVFGEIPATADGIADTYLDNVVITVTY